MNLGALALRREGHGYRAIAAMLGLSVRNVISGVFRARREEVRQTSTHHTPAAPPPEPDLHSPAEEAWAERIAGAFYDFVMWNEDMDAYRASGWKTKPRKWATCPESERGCWIGTARDAIGLPNWGSLPDENGTTTFTARYPTDHLPRLSLPPGSAPRLVRRPLLKRRRRGQVC